MRDKIAQFIKQSVEWLQETQEGCCTYKLDDRLAVCVGWSAGYGDEPRYDIIQAKDDFDFGINVGIKVWTSDYLRTDYDWINFPYYSEGHALDLGVSIDHREDYERLADEMLKCYDDIKDLVITDNGLILEDKNND